MPTYDVTIEGREAKFVIEDYAEDSAFQYVREGRGGTEGILRSFSMRRTEEATYSVLINGRSYQATVAASGEIMVNGRTLAVDVHDPRKLRARGSAQNSSGRQTIAAPMPGRVIRILVEAGQEVESGQGLIVVEAMKMQNEMKSPKAGKVLEVKTATGAAVSAGEALLVIE